jgi:hypothetical protein
MDGSYRCRIALALLWTTRNASPWGWLINGRRRHEPDSTCLPPPFPRITQSTHKEWLHYFRTRRVSRDYVERRGCCSHFWGPPARPQVMFRLGIVLFLY